MTLHFHSSPWQVHDRPDGLHVVFDNGSLDPEALTSLVDELCDLAHANGHRTLYLDCDGLTLPVAALAGKLVELDERLRTSEGRLVLVNAAPPLARLLAAES